MRSEGCNMAVTWKQFEGQIVDDEFPLEQLLASSEHSAVFLTQHGDSQPQKAAIKLIHAEPASAELLLSRWRLAAQLSHPNLLRLLDFGRCCLEDANFLYVVMEFAEEDLSQILPQRPLTPAETRDMPQPVQRAGSCNFGPFYRQRCLVTRHDARRSAHAAGACSVA